MDLAGGAGKPACPEMCLKNRSCHLYTSGRKHLSNTF